MTVNATRDTLAAAARARDQSAPHNSIDAVINYAIELGTNRPDVKPVAPRSWASRKPIQNFFGRHEAS
jgi:hypothetical protein